MGCAASEQQSENLALCRCRCADSSLEAGDTAVRNGLLGVALDSSEPALSSMKSPLDRDEPDESPVEKSEPRLDFSAPSGSRGQAQIVLSAGTGETADLSGYVPSYENDAEDISQNADSDSAQGCQTAQPFKDFDAASLSTAATPRDTTFANVVATGGVSEQATPPVSPASSQCGRVRPSMGLGRKHSVSTLATDLDDPDSQPSPDSPNSPTDSMLSDGSPRPSMAHYGSILTVTAEVPSAAMQMIVENHRSIEEAYTLKKQLGKGSSGSVREGVLKASGAVRAIKKVSKAELKEREGVINEIKIMKTVDHLNVISLFETFEDKNSIHLVMPVAQHGHLKARVIDRGHMSEAEAKPCMRQIVSAVHYLFNNNIAHRDIKPENVLCHSVQPLNLKVTDFGLSRVIRPKRMMTSAVGSPSFMAPEVFRKKYDARCDIWSCGISAYFLLSGYVPFDGESFNEIKDAVLGHPISYGTKEWVDTKQGTFDFLNGMLKKNPRQRFSAEQTFNHEWLQVDNKTLAAKDPHRLFHMIHKFRKSNKLKRSALVVIASMLKTEDHVQHQGNFVALDPNNDGKIDLQEIQQQLKPKSMTDQGVVNMFEDHSSEAGFRPLSYTEFVAATMDKKRLLTPNLCKAAFASFDKDSDGHISMAELAEGHLLGHLSMEELAATFGDTDSDRDGHVSYEEFKAMLLS